MLTIWLRAIGLTVLAVPVCLGNSCAGAAGSFVYTNPAAYTSCGGTYPQTGDTLSIATPTTLNVTAAWPVTSIVLNNAGASIVVSAGVTLTCAGTASCITWTLGNIDVSAAGFGVNKITFTDTSLTTGFVISHSSASPVSMNWSHVIVNAGTLGGSGIKWGGDGTASDVTLTYSTIVGGVQGIVPDHLRNFVLDHVYGNGQSASLVAYGSGAATGCSISYVVDRNNTDTAGGQGTSTFYFPNGYNACTMLNNSFQGDSTHFHSFFGGGGTTSTGAIEIGWNLAYSQTQSQQSVRTNAFAGTAGTATYHTSMHDNFGMDFTQTYEDLTGTAYVDHLRDICEQGNALNGALGGQQGCFDVDGGTNITFTRTVVLYDTAINGANNGGTIAYEWIGNGLAGGFATVTATNITAYLPPDLSAATTGAVNIGDSLSTAASIQPPSFMINSLITGGAYAVNGEAGAFNALSAQCAAGLGGGGFCGNNYFGWGKSVAFFPLTAGAGGANWDNGSVLHPSLSAYAEHLINPSPVYPIGSPITLQQIDGFLGGPSTIAHLYDRLSGAFDTTETIYTPQVIIAYIQASTAPTDQRFATLGPGGVLVGATPPVTPTAIMAAAPAPTTRRRAN